VCSCLSESNDCPAGVFIAQIARGAYWLDMFQDGFVAEKVNLSFEHHTAWRDGK
jgi:hypothetical protein